MDAPVIQPDDWISHHLARQQAEEPSYGEIMALSDGKHPGYGYTDPRDAEWIAKRVAEQEPELLPEGVEPSPYPNIGDIMYG